MNLIKKEVHGKLSNPLFNKNVRGQKHHYEVDECRNSIPYINHWYYVISTNTEYKINNQSYVVKDNPLSRRLLWPWCTFNISWTPNNTEVNCGLNVPIGNPNRSFNTGDFKFNQMLAQTPTPECLLGNLGFIGWHNSWKIVIHHYRQAMMLLNCVQFVPIRNT